MTIQFYKDGSRMWRWRARAVNGRIVADSGESYSDRSKAWKGLGSLLNCREFEVVSEGKAWNRAGKVKR